MELENKKREEFLLFYYVLHKCAQANWPHVKSWLEFGEQWQFYAMCFGMEIFDNAKFFVSLWVFHWTAFRNDDIQASLLKMFVNKT